jgi:uncharacterized Zn finger protein (UPF0148 family)
MPQCPHCQTPYESGQRYCSTCGSFLLHPEEGDTFCPQCGVRVSPRQEFCHECDAPLKGAKDAFEVLGPEREPVPAPTQPPPAPVPSSGTPPWLIGLLVGTGIVIIILLILLFSRGTPTPPAPSPAPKAEVPTTPTTPAPEQAPAAAPELKEQLQSVLSTLREAQMRKDIVQFMSVYSLTFPQLDDKRADTLKAWENFDFTNLVFTVDKVQALDSDNVIAWVTWYIDTRNRRTQELSSYTQTYQVRFVKEMGKWRIRSQEEVEH